MTTAADLTAMHQVTARHIEELRDSEIDALIDKHLFKNDQWCTGQCRFQGYSGTIVLFHCLFCSATDERGAAAQLFGSEGHPRNVPRYTRDMESAWCIIEAMRHKGKAEQVCFLLSVAAPIRGLLQFVFDITPRIVAVAALKALSIVAVDGYVRTEER